MQTPTKRRTAEEWAELLQAFEQSQQTQTEFCRVHGIDAKYFSGKRLAFIKRQSTHNEPSTFARAVLKNHSANQRMSAPAITLCHAQTTLHLSVSTSPAWLAQLLKELA